MTSGFPFKSSPRKLSIPEPLLNQANQTISQKLGLLFPQERLSDLERGILEASAELGIADVQTFVEQLNNSPFHSKYVQILAKYLTVGESYFFRDARGLRIFKKYVIPEILASRTGGQKALKIWSAGCCRGEEPYSLAMILKKLIPDLNSWNLTLLGTDINSDFLKLAFRAKYDEWAFRRTPAAVKKTYFKQSGKNYFELSGEIRGMVKFFFLNLVDDIFPSPINETNGVDIIFCNNVLMYFHPELAKKVVKKFWYCLNEGGWLFVAAPEVSQTLFSEFTPVNFQGTTLYRRITGIAKQEKERISAVPIYSEIPARLSHEVEAVGLPLRESPPIEPAQVEKQEEEVAPYALAEKYFHENDYNRCEAIAASLAVNSNDVQGKKLMAKLCANFGKMDESLQWCKRAIQVNSLDASVHYLTASILLERGQIEEAIQSLRHTLYLDQNFVLAHFSLGSLLRNKQKLLEADRHLRIAFQLIKDLDIDFVLPESDGMSVGYLRELLSSLLQTETAEKRRVRVGR